MRRLKTTKLEKEVVGEDETKEEIRLAGEKMPATTLAKFHLVTGLKNNIKDLRQEIEQRDDQINQYKRNIKISKLEEKNVEIKAYLEECSRLKKLLREAKGKSQTITILKKL